VEVGGDDAEAALGVGVGVGAEEHRSAWESIGFVVGFLRLGLAEDGGQPISSSSPPAGTKERRRRSRIT